jgi:hypothetical protein
MDFGCVIVYGKVRFDVLYEGSASPPHATQQWGCAGFLGPAQPQLCQGLCICNCAHAFVSNLPPC